MAVFKRFVSELGDSPAGGNPYADAKIRASISPNVKNARKPAPIACMVLASKDPRDVFIVVVSRVWIGLTDTRNTELRRFLFQVPQSLSRWPDHVYLHPKSGHESVWFWLVTSRRLRSGQCRNPGRVERVQQ